MNELEARVRRLIIRTIFVIIIVGLISDVGFFAFYYMNNYLIYEVPVYIIRRIVIPTTINILAYIVAKMFDDSKKENSMNKYWACSMSLCIVAGSISVFHSFFTPLWICPAIAMLFCSVFHDFKLIRVMFIFSMAIVCISFNFVIYEHPGNLLLYVQHALVCGIITVIAFLLSNTMEEYARSVNELDKENLAKEIELKRKLDFDPLTEVHSRGFMELKTSDMLKNANRLNPVTIAIIDIDEFKQINDRYGHDNGDKVLRTLGLLLNSLIDERYTIVGRYGGEEFIFAFEGGTIREHQELLDALRESFSMIDFSFMGPNNNKCTFSGGITVTYERKSFEEVLKVADDALYEAKGKGKNILVRR